MELHWVIIVLKFELLSPQKGKGKSGGAGVISNFFITDNTVYLLSIYDKSEKKQSFQIMN